MRILLYLASALAAIAGFSLEAAPIKGVPKAETEATYIPFDPPLGQPLRYRWQQTVTSNGKAEISWSVSSHQFEKTEDGYRLTVTPISDGSNETDPAMLELERRLKELTNFPFVLILAADGSIVELEKSQVYWDAIDTAIKEYASKSASPEMAAAMNSVRKMFSEMPEETRLALLTESVSPLLEFGETEFVVGRAASVQIEMNSPFGGTSKSDVVVTLQDVDQEVASFSVTSQVPREELNRLIGSFAAKMETWPEAEREKLRKAIADLEDFRHVTRSSYKVSTSDGMLQSYSSTETVESLHEGKITKKVTDSSLVWAD